MCGQGYRLIMSQEKDKPCFSKFAFLLRQSEGHFEGSISSSCACLVLAIFGTLTYGSHRTHLQDCSTALPLVEMG